MLAQQARRLINLLDDTPMVPGEERPAFDNAEAAREVLNDAEASLRNYSPSIQPIHSSAGKLGTNAMPGSIEQEASQANVMQRAAQRVQSGEATQPLRQETTQTQRSYPASETTTA